MAWKRGLPLTDVPDWQAGTFANRPGAGTVTAGTIYYATDTDVVYESTGAAWNVVPYSALTASEIPDLSATYQVVSAKNANNGYCGLDGTGDVASAQLGNAVESIKKSGAATLRGNVTLSEGTNVTLTQSGQDISIASTGGGGGVDTLAAEGETGLTGDVTLSEGTGVTLTQSGQDIEIAASGSAAGTAIFDTKPSSPHANDVEVIEATADTLPSGWSVVGNSGGTAPSVGTVLGFWDNLAPTTNKYSINSDQKGKWFMCPAAAKVMIATRTFAPTAATEFAVVIKFNWFLFGTGTADDRVTLFLDTTAPTSTSTDYGFDSVAVEWRPLAATPDVRAFLATNGAAGATTSISGNPTFPAHYTSPMYLAITCETSNALSCWASRDGTAWQRVQRYTAGDVVGNIAHVGVSVQDATGAAAMIAAWQFIRFRTADNAAWKLGYGL
jgi:hypothetical protein